MTTDIKKLSKAALRKRVSRIELKLDAGRNVSDAERALVAEYRRTHKRYASTKQAVTATAQLRDIDASDEAAIAEQLAAEGLDDTPPSNGQRDGVTAQKIGNSAGHDGLSDGDRVGTADDTVSVVTEDLPIFSAEAMEGVQVTTGVCPVPTCRTPLADGQLRCGKCGAWAHPEICPKCKDRFVDGEQFCRRDGTPRPNAVAQAVQTNAAGQTVAVAAEPLRMWDAKNTRWLMDVVDMALERTGMDKLDDEERKQLVGALVPVLNKQLPASGKWAEEIRLGVVSAGVFFPRFYIKWVILPERQANERRKEELHQAQLRATESQAKRAEESKPVEVAVRG